MSSLQHTNLQEKRKVILTTHKSTRETWHYLYIIILRVSLLWYSCIIHDTSWKVKCHLYNTQIYKRSGKSYLQHTNLQEEDDITYIYLYCASLYFDTHASFTTRREKRYVIFTTHKSTREEWHYSSHEMTIYVYVSNVMLHIHRLCVSLPWSSCCYIGISLLWYSCVSYDTS